MNDDIDPWRDRSYYMKGPICSCLGCGKSCNKTYWGKWCYECNVKRIERISKAFKELSK